jgi:hypothetical protein
MTLCQCDAGQSPRSCPNRPVGTRCSLSICIYREVRVGESRRERGPAAKTTADATRQCHNTKGDPPPAATRVFPLPGARCVRHAAFLRLCASLGIIVGDVCLTNAVALPSLSLGAPSWEDISHQPSAISHQPSASSCSKSASAHRTRLCLQFHRQFSCLLSD